MKRALRIGKIWTWAGLLLLVLIIAGSLLFLLSPASATPKKIVSSTPNVIVQQQLFEESLLQDYQNGAYDLENPYLIQNPYGNSPLTALVLFESEQAAQVSVKVTGKDANTDVTYTFPDYVKHHEVPIIGLYAGVSNEVQITANLEDGSQQTKTLQLVTETLPQGFPARVVISSNPQDMEPGWTLINSDTYKYFLDANGDIRWYLNILSNNILTRLDNGHFLMAYLPTPPFSYGDAPDKLIETDLLGKIFAYYYTPMIHHDVIAYGDQYLATVGDTIYQFDRQQGNLLTQSLDLWPFYPTERVFDYQPDPNSLHVNSLLSGGELGNQVLISARNQHALTLLDYAEQHPVWILGADDRWRPEDELLLYQPEGTDFEWFWMQHAPQVLPDVDQDESTLDLLLFDNGYFRDGRIDIPQDQLYSRLVRYRLHLNTMRVEQIWEYGKERGEELYSQIKGSAVFLPITNHVLGTFAEVPSTTTENGYDAVLVEVNEHKEVISEIRLLNTRSVYRGDRVDYHSILPQSALTENPGRYLQNDGPYQVYQFPLRQDLSAAADYERSLYRQSVNKFGSKYTRWIDRALRYGLITKVKFSPLPLELNKVTLIEEDLFIEGRVQLAEGEDPELYLVLSSGDQLYTYDISSAYFRQADEKGMRSFYLNYLNIADLPAGCYRLAFFTSNPQGTRYTESQYILNLNP